MPFNAALVGRRWGPIDWSLSPRRALAFRAALRPNEIEGLDDLAEPGRYALPMQVVTPEWTIALASRADPDQSLSPAEAARAVHAGQDTRFHRPLPFNAKLKVFGELTAVRRSRAGVVTNTIYRLHDAKSDALYAQTLSTTVYRGVDLAGDDTPGESTQAQPPLGAAARLREIPTQRGLPHIYSECAEIWNPIHTERRAALAAGLDDIIIHGTALWALAGLEVCAAAGRSAHELSRLAARFSAPAIPGETLTLCWAPSDDAIRLELRGAAGRVLSGVAAF